MQEENANQLEIFKHQEADQYASKVREMHSLQTSLRNLIDPAAAFAAIGSVGADLPPEVREQAEEVVVSAIIAGGTMSARATSTAISPAS